MALNLSTLRKPINPQVVDPETGQMREEWFLYFGDLTKRVNAVVGELSGSLGDVTGPASAVNGNIAVFDDTTGKLIADGGVSIAALQPIDAGLTDIAGLAVTDGNIIVGDGTNWVAESGATAFSSIKQTATISATGVVELATDAEVYAATTGALALVAAHLETASASVALSDAATVAINWDSAINFTLTVTANRVIGNPTNGQPGTWRTIYLLGNDATDRTITFGNQFLGEVPTITDADSTRAYLLMIYCVTASHFVVSSKKALGT